ncbi:MAG: hypothetical protein ACI3Z0_05325 [Candidatus Cryptobacteroides sp.]
MSKIKYEKISFTLCLVVSIGLIVGGFLVPPTGVIDGSVLKAVGMLVLFAVIDMIPKILSAEKNIKISKGDMSIDVNDGNDK